MAAADGSKYSFRTHSFDPARCEFIRDGVRQRVPEQISRLLEILLERAGTLVSRAELRQLLWPGGEYLDFDHSINKAISHLRTVLGDDPKAPEFIETIPKRGYRFLAAVSVQLAASDFVSVQTATAPVSAAEGMPQVLESTLLTRHDADAAGHAAVDDQAAGVLARADKPTQARPRRVGAATGLWVAAAVLVLVVLSAWGHLAGNVADAEHPIYLGIAPFEAVGPGAELLAQSFRLDLSDAVSELPGVQVRATHSLADLARQDSVIRALSHSLHLDVLLFGKITVQNDVCQLQLELIRGRDAVYLGSLQYRGTREELTSIRDKAQRDIYARLNLAGQTVQRMHGSTENPAAYAAYLRARYQLSLRSQASSDRALLEFAAAIAADPSFAKAYAGMATAHVLRADYQFAPNTESLAKAEELASRALKLTVSLPEAHGVLGYTLFRRDWNARLAESELRHALELDPNQALFHVWLSVLLSDEGRFDESFQQIDLAHTDDPLWAPIYGAETFIAENAQNSPREMAAAQKLVELRPGWPIGIDELAWAFWHAGRYEEAIGAWQRMAVLENDSNRLHFEEKGLAAWRIGGVPAYAREHLDAIKDGASAGFHANDFVAAEWYAYAGDRKNAIAALTDLVARHDPEVLQIAVGPAYRNLHTEPDFQSLVARVGLFSGGFAAN